MIDHNKYPNVVYEDEDYFIQVNSITECTYVQLWNIGRKENKIVGRLHTNPARFHGGIQSDDYLEISSVGIESKHRNQGYGLKLYRTLLKHMDSSKKGIISYLPDRSNKKQIPAIYRKLGGRLTDSLAIVEKN